MNLSKRSYKKKKVICNTPDLHYDLLRLFMLIRKILRFINYVLGCDSRSCIVIVVTGQTVTQSPHPRQTSALYSILLSDIQMKFMMNVRDCGYFIIESFSVYLLCPI